MIGNEIKVSVGIPTYNRSAFLRQSIQSMLGQTHRNFRLIVSDNASTDDTAEVVASFDDPRIHYTRTDENIGMTANFNRILELTETEFVAILYDDDLFYPQYLDYTVTAIEAHPRVGIVHTAFDLIDRDGQFPRASKDAREGFRDRQHRAWPKLHRTKHAPGLDDLFAISSVQNRSDYESWGLSGRGGTAVGCPNAQTNRS